MIRFSGFFARVYLLAILLLVSVLVSLTLFLEVHVEGVDADETLAIAEWIGERLYRSRATGSLDAELSDFGSRMDIAAVLYSPTGELLAKTPGAALDPATEFALESLKRGEAVLTDDEQAFVGAYEDGELAAYFVFDDVSHVDIGFEWPTVGIVLAVLAIICWPLARRFSRPLEELAARVQAFGSGELTSRVRSRRRDEIGDVARRFDAMADQVTVLLKSERELLAAVSHEFRTPLQRLRLFLDILESRHAIEPTEAAAVADDITELDELVHDIMLAARLERETTTDVAVLSASREELGEVVDGACHRFRSLFSGRELIVGEHPPLSVHVDARLVARAISNLLHNAHKYSPAGQAIEVELRLENERAVVLVSDRGIGVPPGAHEEIFEPFERRSQKASGLGLGLALVRRITTLHDGSVVVTPREGGGSLFRVELPLASSD